MAKITKIQFCEKIIEQKVTMASCDCLEVRDWCEQIKLVLENGTILTIESAQAQRGSGLFFKQENVTP